MEKRRSTPLPETTVIPYTTSDSSFTTIFHLYDKTTTRNAVDTEPTTTPTTLDIDSMKKEIQKELDRIKSSLDKLGDKTEKVALTTSPRAVTNSFEDLELQKLEKARQELMKELEKIDTTLERFKTKHKTQERDENKEKYSLEKSTNSLDEITDHVLKKVWISYYI